MIASAKCAERVELVRSWYGREVIFKTEWLGTGCLKSSISLRGTTYTFRSFFSFVSLRSKLKRLISIPCI